MKYSRRIILSVMWVVIGVVLNILCYMNLLDSFWSGFGVGFVMVGAIQIFRQVKYRTNDDYKEKVDVEMSDERNKYLSMKAWAWTGYIFVIVAAIATIVFKMTGYDDVMMVSSAYICLLVLLYYISYMILKRKY